MKKLILIYILFICANVAFSQDQIQYSQILKTQGLLNPAYNGVRDMVSGIILYRNQWTGIDGAPVSEAINIHSPINMLDGLGGGIVVTRDQVALDEKINAYAAISYHINFNDDKARLSFGLQGGINSFRVDLSKVISDKGSIDPLFSSQQSWLKPNFGAGVFYYTNNFFAGLSVPEMFYYTSSTSTYSTKNFQYFYYAGYLIDKLQDFKLKPAILVEQMAGTPLQLDVSFNTYYKDIVGVNIGWRRNDALIFGIDYNITPFLGISYSYDYTLSTLNLISKGSHEISITFEISKTPSAVKQKNIDNIKIPNIRYF